MITSHCCILLLCFAGSCGIPLQTKPDVVAAINKYLYSSCVLLPMIGEQHLNEEFVATEMQIALSGFGISTVVVDNDTLKQADCATSKPIQILLFDGPDVQNYVKEATKNGRWLIFMQMKPNHIEEFFKDIHIPINFEFFVVQIDQDNETVVSEVYRVERSLPLQVHRLSNTSNNNLYLRRNNLTGLVLKSVILPMVHLVDECEWKNGEVTKITGYFGEVWNELQKLLNFSTKFLKSTDKSFGVKLPNGTWDGLIGSIIKQDADVSCNAFQHTPQRLEKVNYLIPIMQTKFYVYIKKPGISTNWDNFLEPFHTVLWKIIFISIIAISACLSASWYIASRSSNFGYILYESLFRIIGNFCYQGFDMNIKYSACRTVLLTSYLTAIVLLAAYSAALISSLTVQDLKLPFRTYSEMLQDGRYTMGSIAGTAHISFFENTSDPVLEKVYSKIISPELTFMAMDAFSGIQRICERTNYAFFLSEYTVNMHMKNMPCSVVPVPGTAFPSRMSMIVSKNSSYKNILEYYTKQLLRTGILKRLYREAFPILKESVEPSFQELDLQAIIPLLAVLGIGIILSILILTSELILHKFSSRYPNIFWSLKNLNIIQRKNSKLKRAEEYHFKQHIMSKKYPYYSSTVENKLMENEVRNYRKDYVEQNVWTRTQGLTNILCLHKIKK